MIRLSPPAAPITDEDLLKHQWAFIALDLLVLDPSQLQHGLSLSMHLWAHWQKKHVTCRKRQFKQGGARKPNY